MPIIGHETWSIHHIRNIVHVSDVTGYLPAKGRGGGGDSRTVRRKSPLAYLLVYYAFNREVLDIRCLETMRILRDLIQDTSQSGPAVILYAKSGMHIRYT